MGLGIDGLASGLDTTSLINSLMQIEAIPQTSLKSRLTATQSKVTALQGLNAQVASLATLAKKYTASASLDLYSATSSSAKVTASTTASAAAGSVDFTVTQLAQKQVSVSDKMASWQDAPDSPPILTIVIDGESKEITAASESLDDVISAINAAKAGVTASKVPVGDGLFRLQFTATDTGKDAGFAIHNGSAAAVAAADGSATPVSLVEIQKAQDAEVVLWAGTAAQETITPKSNTFTELLPGASITVSAVSADPVTVKVARDNAAVSKVASDLVSSVNGVLATISTKSTVVSSTTSTGAATTSGGIFTGDSTIRDVNQKILDAASRPVDGISPSEYGIVLTKTGTMEFDATKFADAMAKDPVATTAAINAIATRISDAASQASDSTSGLLTTKITGQQTDIKDFTDQIATWDDRLVSRRATLQQTYTALEVALSSMQAQSSWLSSQLDGLSSSSS